MVAAIKAANDYQELLGMSVGSAGNDHRLGANKAPPAIVPMFLGDELTGILEVLEAGTDYQNIEKYEKHQMEIGVTVLPHFLKDTIDCNRTSPFAFTGNKYYVFFIEINNLSQSLYSLYVRYLILGPPFLNFQRTSYYEKSY